MASQPRPSKPPPRPPGNARREPNPWSLVGLGFEFAGMLVLLTLGGWWLDERWGTGPLFMLIGLAIGLIGGVYNFWRVGKQFF